MHLSGEFNFYENKVAVAVDSELVELFTGYRGVCPPLTTQPRAFRSNGIQQGASALDLRIISLHLSLFIIPVFYNGFPVERNQGFVTQAQSACTFPSFAIHPLSTSTLCR